jgi:hypothetical protein
MAINIEPTISGARLRCFAAGRLLMTGAAVMSVCPSRF